MALDGLFLHKLTEELKSAEGMHIEKIYQPANDELVLLLRRAGENRRLLISAAAQSPRILFTTEKYENPLQPPTLCMLFRKHLSSAKITEISQIGLERVLVIKTVATNEMGDTVYPEIVVELMGVNSNIILTVGGKIIDAVHRSGIETATRIIHPGAVYLSPSRPDKINLLEGTLKDLSDRIYTHTELPLEKAILLSAEGFSPLICREVAADTDNIRVSLMTGYHKNMCEKRLQKIRDDLLANGAPIVLVDQDGNNTDFTFTEISQYGPTVLCKTFDSYSQLLEEFYHEKAVRQRIAKQSGDILKTLSVLSARAQKRLSMRCLDLKNTENRENLRIYGELIKANIYLISQGQTFAEVPNFYDEELKNIRIPLNPALTPAANAAKYFKDYKKSYTAEQTLIRLIEQDKAEIEYFDTVLDALSRAENSADIAEIRDELAAGGYIKRPVDLKRQTVKQTFGEEVSPSGLRILYGKNNRMNDLLTTKAALKNDLWFHAKGVAGSHVVILCGQNTPTDEDIEFAAKIAAEHSSAVASGTVAVDYTRVKNVKKPSGAKPGMVIYTDQKTVFIRL